MLFRVRSGTGVNGTVRWRGWSAYVAVSLGKEVKKGDFVRLGTYEHPNRLPIQRLHAVRLSPGYEIPPRRPGLLHLPTRISDSRILGEMRTDLGMYDLLVERVVDGEEGCETPLGDGTDVDA